MTDEPRTESQHTAEDFARQAEAAPSGLIREFYDLVRHNRKWWLLPIIMFLLLLSVMISLSGTALAPLIYTLF